MAFHFLEMRIDRIRSDEGLKLEISAFESP